MDRHRTRQTRLPAGLSLSPPQPDHRRLLLTEGHSQAATATGRRGRWRRTTPRPHPVLLFMDAGCTPGSGDAGGEAASGVWAERRTPGFLGQTCGSPGISLKCRLRLLGLGCGLRVCLCRELPGGWPRWSGDDTLSRSAFGLAVPTHPPASSCCGGRGPGGLGAPTRALGAWVAGSTARGADRTRGRGTGAWVHGCERRGSPQRRAPEHPASRHGKAAGRDSAHGPGICFSGGPRLAGRTHRTPVPPRRFTPCRQPAPLILWQIHPLPPPLSRGVAAPPPASRHPGNSTAQV